MRLKQNILCVTLILLIAIFCFGCGKNEHEIEPDLEDKYGYSGTWFGQVSQNSFMIFNILPKKELKESYFSKSAFTYDMVNFVYVLSSSGEINDREIILAWQIVMDERQADFKKDTETLFIYGGISAGPGLGFENTSGWGHMKRDGKKLLLANDKNETIKFVQEDDYDDLLDEVDELKEKIEEDIKKALRSHYPNAKIKIVNNFKPPAFVIK